MPAWTRVLLIAFNRTDYALDRPAAHVHCLDSVPHRRAKFQEALAGIGATEEYFAYPGPRLIKALQEAAAANDARAPLNLARGIATALVTRSFRQHGDSVAGQNESDAFPGLAPPALGRGATQRPYFETLI